MSKKHLNRFALLVIVVLPAVSYKGFSQTAECDASHAAAMECQGRRVKDLDDELNRVYQLALAAMPEKDDQDLRRSREQLRKSQRAWLTYLHENCALEGGLQGGSNSWVSTFAADCEEKALTDRITFLRAVAGGTVGSH